MDWAANGSHSGKLQFNTLSENELDLTLQLSCYSAKDIISGSYYVYQTCTNMIQKHK